MQHQDHQPGAVQAHGFTDLVQDEFAVALVLRRCQAFRAAGNFDGIGVGDSKTLEKLGESQLEAVVEAPDHRRVAMIFLARRIEMKNLVHGRLPVCHRGQAQIPKRANSTTRHTNSRDPSGKNVLLRTILLAHWEDISLLERRRVTWVYCFQPKRPIAGVDAPSLSLAPAMREATHSSPAPATLKSLSLEELSQVEVTTPSKGPEKVMQTPAAIYVITGDDIQRSGATNIPDALRLAPGVEVAQLDAHQWSVGIRGFGSNLTRNILVLMDGRTVYSTLLAGTYWESAKHL